MILVKDKWEQSDIEPFEKYLLSFSKGTFKGEWEKKIANTSLNCIAVPRENVAKIVREIAKGNFISFLDLWLWNNLTETIIAAELICKIKDFEIFSNYLKIFANKIDNWASCDSLKPKITKENENKFFDLASDLIKSSKPFVKRVGFCILLKMLGNERFVDLTLDIVGGFKDEKEYYVNMMIAWIVCESFIKHRDKTLIFLQKGKLSKFVVNKAISKCHDSFRVSNEDKEMLKKYRIK